MHLETPGGARVQIVPAGPGGVRDHALVLQEHWARGGCASQLLELTEDSVGDLPLAQRLRTLQGRHGAAVAVLLHFSGYGYHPRGLCHWLLAQLQAARNLLGPQLRVVSLFHELFASGPPWRSAFWLAGRQAEVARRLALASQAVVTNTDHHARWLRAQGDAGQLLHTQPVFSNIGEPEDLPAAQKRRNELVVFGSASTRQRALARLPRHRATLRRLGIERVLEVGPAGPTPMQSTGLDFQHLGRLHEAELSALLLGVRFGLIDYPSVHLGKSGVFAGYAAHGCVVLNTADHGPDADGLQAGRHYLSLHRLARGGPGCGPDMNLQDLSEQLRAWYAPHSAALQAQALARLLSRPGPA